MASALHSPPPAGSRWRQILGFRRGHEAERAAQLDSLRQLDGVMGEVVHRLAPDDQLLVALRFGGAMTVAQVARLTHRSKDAVRLQQLKVLRMLQHELETRASQ